MQKIVGGVGAGEWGVESILLVIFDKDISLEVNNFSAISQDVLYV